MNMQTFGDETSKLPQDATSRDDKAAWISPRLTTFNIADAEGGVSGVDDLDFGNS